MLPRRNRHMNVADQRKLAKEGYLVLEHFMNETLLSDLRQRVEQLFLEEGEQAGSEFLQEPNARRLANLVDKGEIFQQMIAAPRVLESVASVLGSKFKLSSLNARSANPYSDSGQPLHVDMAAIPDEKGYWVCNTIWMLDDFTRENGATRIIPGSHRRRKLPQDVLADPQAPHAEETLLTGKAGTVVIMNAHMWHAGTANRTANPRRALHAFFCRWDKPQQQYQKAMLRAEVQQRLSSQLRELLALDDPLNDQLSSRVTVRSGFMKK